MRLSQAKDHKGIRRFIAGLPYDIDSFDGLRTLGIIMNGKKSKAKKQIERFEQLMQRAETLTI